jgi:hypothetical protein
MEPMKKQSGFAENLPRLGLIDENSAKVHLCFFII